MRYPGEACSAARTLELVGERWTLLILREAMFGGARRYSEFAATLGIATNVLAKRLDGLVAAGLMDARVGSRPDHREYHLTRKGLELKPVVMALTAWGDKWLGPGPVTFQHRSAAAPVTLELQSAGAPIDVADVIAVRRQQPGDQS